MIRAQNQSTCLTLRNKKERMDPYKRNASFESRCSILTRTSKELPLIAKNSVSTYFLGIRVGLETTFSMDNTNDSTKIRVTVIKGK